jgi:hypothetical protein
MLSGSLSKIRKYIYVNLLFVQKTTHSYIHIHTHACMCIYVHVCRPILRPAKNVSLYCYMSARLKKTSGSSLDFLKEFILQFIDINS